MISTIKEDFKPPERTFVFTTSSLDLFNEYKNLKFHKPILDAVEKGKVNAVFTPLELAKLKKYVGEGKYRKTYVSVFKSPKSKVFCMEMDLYSKRSLPCYSQLFNSLLSSHLADLSSAITSIELMIPLITDDDHHWSVQQNLRKAYDERHRKEIADCLARKERRKYFEMYTSKDFCEMFLV
jgi:disulfide oxidoreductase YuzD